METAQVLEFIGELADAETAQAKFEKHENEKRAALEKMFDDLTPEKKEELRAGMTFRVVDKKGKNREKSFNRDGQEHSVDTFGSVKKGRGIGEKDWPKVQKAMSMVVDLTRKALDKKASDGSPLFKSVDEIEVEVFTPLVREGLLPETFVLDEFSEVQKLLNNAFGNYKETLKDKEKEKLSKASKIAIDYHGAGEKTDSAKALLGKISQRKDALMSSVGLTNKTVRRAGIVKDGLSTVWALKGVATEIKGWVPGQDGAQKNLTKADRFLNPKKYQDLLTPERMKALEDTNTQNDPDAISMALEQQRREERLKKSLGGLGEKLSFMGLSKEQMEAVGKDLAGIIELSETNEAFYTQASLLLTKELVTDGIDIGTKAYDIHKLREVLEQSHNESKVYDAVNDLVEAIDEALVNALDAARPGAGSAIGGLYEKSVDIGALEKASAPATSGPKMVSILAAGFQTAMTKAAPVNTDPVAAAFRDAGKKMADAFIGKADAKPLEKSIQSDPLGTLAPLIGVASTAAAAGVTSELKKLLNDPKTVAAMAGKAAFPDEEEALDELEKADEEIKDYEKMLVLIDEGGISAAEQKRIEVLILELQKDQQVLELVSTLGSTLSGVAGGSVGIASWASETLTDVVAGQITGPIKAAQMIMQLAVNIKKAATRWALFRKFQTDLERSKVAVSSLTSTIQGFFDNKQAQCTFHTIEDALLAVQIAATILQTVPTPYTVAIGKTMSVVAGAAQQANKFANKVYDEKKLTEAWSTTKAALNSPRDRALGLKALRLNTTLAMHGIAWAALEKTPPDPIARMVLNSLGLNEQTLAVSGTQEKVREYLETTLYEDRKLIDSEELKATWVPNKLALNAGDWFVVTSRAARDAAPKLRKGDEKAVFEGLKKVEKHDLKKLAADADKGAIEPRVLARTTKEANTVRAALRKYAPVTIDGSPHDEMSSVADEFLRLIAEHIRELDKIESKNMGVQIRDEKLAVATLNDHIAAVEEIAKHDDNNVFKNFTTADLEDVADGANDFIKALKQAGAVTDKQLVKSTMQQLETKLERIERLIWAGDPGNSLGRLNYYYDTLKACDVEGDLDAAERELPEARKTIAEIQKLQDIEANREMKSIVDELNKLFVTLEKKIKENG
jgi:hypothetical protein